MACGIDKVVGMNSVLQKNTVLKENQSLVTFGVCADLHQDFIPDGERRLKSFITEMNRLKPNFILQLGDFCQPNPSNIGIMDIWNQFKRPKYQWRGIMKLMEDLI